MSSNNNYNINLANITGAAEVTFAVSNVIRQVISGFNRDGFLQEFITKNHVTTELELLDRVLDASRCLFGPKVDNWPGATIVLDQGGTNETITLQAGQTKLAPFKKNNRGPWSWSHCCMAFAGVFKEVWRQHARDHVDLIPGAAGGYTSYCTTLAGFTINDYDACVTAMDNWVNAQGVTKRDAELKARIRIAVSKNITARTIEKDQALSFRQMIKYLAQKTAPIAGENVSK